MGGFKKESNNIVFEQNLFNLIIQQISESCSKMKKDCQETGKYLYNHEDKISNRLVEQYLDVNSFGLRFILQKLEYYDVETDTFKSRTDITVVSFDWIINNRDAYYIIECKRIDGKSHLNKEYVSEGISRFVVSSSPKYPSYYGKSIMLGYIVQDINISANMEKIDKFQRELLANVTIGEMKPVCNDNNSFSHYKCFYQTNGEFSVELTHLFYNLSGVIYS